MRNLAALLLLVLAGCHSRNDPGPFRLGADTIQPVHTGWWHRIVYRKPVLLTFDDGPEDLATDRKILATLSRHHARALWLVSCKNLDPAIDPDASEHREALREIVAQGHLIGNHGYSHVDLRPLDSPAMKHEVDGCSDLITRLIGHRPRYFRPPFGLHSPKVDRWLQASGMRLILWGGNSYDSLLAGFKRHPATYSAYIKEHPGMDVALLATSGDVLLFHDYPNTALALDGFMMRLEHRHFQFVLPQAL